MKKCETSDLPRLCDFYRTVAAETENIVDLCRWVYGLYPDDDIIEYYVSRGYAYFSEEDGEITAAVAVTPYQTEDYHEIDWLTALGDDEVAVVHLLAVSPRYQKRGIAKTVMKEMIAHASSERKKAVRLDALASNTPAHRLYESLGFERRGVCRWYADNTGLTDFYLYEFPLNGKKEDV